MPLENLELCSIVSKVAANAAGLSAPLQGAATPLLVPCVSSCSLRSFPLSALAPSRVLRATLVRNVSLGAALLLACPPFVAGTARLPLQRDTARHPRAGAEIPAQHAAQFLAAVGARLGATRDRAAPRRAPTASPTAHCAAPCAGVSAATHAARRIALARQPRRACHPSPSHALALLHKAPRRRTAASGRPSVLPIAPHGVPPTHLSNFLKKKSREAYNRGNVTPQFIYRNVTKTIHFAPQLLKYVVRSCQNFGK